MVKQNSTCFVLQGTPHEQEYFGYGATKVSVYAWNYEASWIY